MRANRETVKANQASLHRRRSCERAFWEQWQRKVKSVNVVAFFKKTNTKSAEQIAWFKFHENEIVLQFQQSVFPQRLG